MGRSSRAWPLWAWLLAASCSNSPSLSPEDLSVEHEPDLLGYPDHTVWAVSAGGDGFDHANSIAVDAKDNAIITGEVVAGPWYAASLSPGGGFSWNTTSLTTGSYNGAAVTVEQSGDVLVTGNVNGTLKIGALSAKSRGGRDVFMVRLSNLGKPLWLWSGGGDEDDQGASIDVDSLGNIFVVGEFNMAAAGQGTARFGDTTLTATNLADVFVVKLSPVGKVLWALSVGGQSYEAGSSIATLADGGAVICGTFNDKVSFGGHTLTSNGESDLFVARLAADGRVMWAMGGGGAGDDGARAVAALPSPAGVLEQSLVVAGRFQRKASLGPITLTSRGDQDCYVARIDPRGRFIWATGFGGSGVDFCGNLAVTPAGIHVVGAFEDKAYFGITAVESRGRKDVFVASYAPDGGLQWVAQAGGPGLDEGAGIAAYSDGTLGVTGIFRDHAYFGRTKLISQGLTDIFVWRLRPPM